MVPVEHGAGQVSSVDDPDGFTHRFANVNGIRLHFVEEGEGPLVMFLHGYPFLWYLWRHQVKAMAAAGFRAVAVDQRGYGQSDCPTDVASYDITRLAGDVVGLINALGGGPAVLVGQDWGTPVAYHTTLMRPDLVSGVVMMCTPPSARGLVRPADAFRAYADAGIHYYMTDLGRPGATAEIMRDLRGFLLGIFYSTSGYCTDEERWRWAWRDPETVTDTYVVPATLPPHLSQQALDYYVGEFTRTGITPANNWYAAIDAGWDNTSFLDGAVVHQPALFLTGEHDPAMKPLFGIARQEQAFASLQTNFTDMRGVIVMPGVGHTPPEERPDDVNAVLLTFLEGLGS